MKLYDLIETSVGNLWRMKLRAFLTISGVVIAIGAFVAMLSFGAGNQKYISDQYNEFGLFTTMQIYPKGGGENDTTTAAILNRQAIQTLSEIPGVRLVYPYSNFEITAIVADTQVTTRARALPGDAMQTKLFSKVQAGNLFSEDTLSEAIVTDELMELTGIDSPDSLVGRQLVISMKTSSLDSALISLIDAKNESISDRLKGIRFDSLFNMKYRQRVMREELNAGLKRFIEGFMSRQVTISDTLTICGVIEHLESHRIRSTPIIIKETTARHLMSGGSGIGSDPADIFAAMQSGNFFSPNKLDSAKSFPQVTLDFDPGVPYQPIKDSVEALGFRSFSYAEQFKEIQRFFLYFNLGLGVIGLIALLTAALGIVNTMVMSILERRREIGILKSLGADEREIRFMFLVESGAIGAIGAATGILVGWITTRIISAIARIIMEREGIPPLELFALPVWLILIAFFFGLIVSLLAGFYPASRAARVNPVEALRSE